MLSNNNERGLASVNQIYMRSDAKMQGVHFKNWIDPLKREYGILSNNPNTRPNMDFVNWLNVIEKEHNLKAERQQKALQERKRLSMEQSFKNADKESPENVKKGIAEQEKRRKEALKDNSILGMKPLVFYSVASVLVIAIGVGIYFTVKKLKKSQTN